VTRQIQLRGVRVHNLKNVDLDIPHQRLVVFCGVSGSGKTSVALDTLYAEGQRRYIESFSAYTRQFLDPFEKPDADRIDGIPPAIAVTRHNTSRSRRATVGTASEITDHLRLLFARVGRVVCHGCGQFVTAESAETVTDQLLALAPDTRFLLTFAQPVAGPESLPTLTATARQAGFARVLVGNSILPLTEATRESCAAAGNAGSETASAFVVVDRLIAGQCARTRLQDSVETAMHWGDGVCQAWVAGAADGVHDSSPNTRQIDGRCWRRRRFSDALRCDQCNLDYQTPEPRLLSFNSPLGACPRCEGFGNVMDIDMDLVVPDPEKTLRQGAIAPWNTPAYRHELDELLTLAEDYEIPIDVPFRTLSDASLRLIHEGVPERQFGGLRGFFQWLERRKYKVQMRVFLSRWRRAKPCPACHGDRLRPAGLAVRLGGKNLADVCRLEVRETLDFVTGLDLNAHQRSIAAPILSQVEARLRYLHRVGLGYLTLDRMVKTLSGGEAQRVALTSALGSTLVNMLYVLDEPSVGLHPRDVGPLIRAVQDLRERNNSVVVVEHEPEMLRAADRLIEFGPGAGERGGEVVFAGTLDEMLAADESLTGDYLAGRRGVGLPRRRDPTHGWITLRGARGNNLKNVTVKFPLGVLCLVTGVSGSGKSTLVQDTLYGALARRKQKPAAAPGPCDDVLGAGKIDDVVLVDQSPIGHSPRSNPVTYIKAFDAIRAVFADTLDARTHNYTAGHFSFNVDGGRCPNCKGQGYVEIDMKFLADVYIKCEQCGGTRYRREIREVMYRGRNIADVLEMTVRQSFAFFRGKKKVQLKLKQLMDVGLDYLRLGQPANTLSAGEAQRLKLASHIVQSGRRRTLFLLDEPTTGLHFADIVQLLDCFDALLSVGHSLVIVEHNLQLMQAADYIIDLGPGASDAGGQVVVAGTPEHVAACPHSATGCLLAKSLAEIAAWRKDPS